MKRTLLALVLIPMLSGCAAMVRYRSPSLADAPSGPSTTVRSLGFLWGLVPPSHISLEQCGPNGIKSMKVKQNFVDAIITYGTVGIVISYKVRINCAG